MVCQKETEMKRLLENWNTYRNAAMKENLEVESDPEAVADLAQALGQSQAVQAVLADLSRDPEIQAALEDALAQAQSETLAEVDSDDWATAGMAASGGLLSIASLVAGTPGAAFAAQLLPALAASPALATLGLVGGTGLLALATLLTVEKLKEGN